jgi:putative ABC transport system permease protein
MKNHKIYTITNVVGLAIGLAVAFLIVLYIQFELSYDRFQEKGDRLYRVSVVVRKNGIVGGESPQFVPPLGPAMKAEFPEVEDYARLSTLRPAYISHDERALKVEGVAFADSSFFNLFSFKLLSGDPRTALAPPFSIILTEDIAEKIFGKENPVGKTVKLDNSNLFTITGVAQQPPPNSHIQFDALVSFSTLYRLPDVFLDWNGGEQYIAYVLLAPGATPGDVQRRFPDLMWKNINKQFSGIGIAVEPYLQPMKDIHLYYDAGSSSVRTNIYVLGAIAILILFIGCVNFINLAIAQAVPRSKEVGIRKVLGASRSSLIGRFLGESLMLSGLAIVLALLFMELLSGTFGDRSGTFLHSQLHAGTVGILIAISGFVALASGLYPALYLSSIQTVRTLKGGAASFRKGSRNILVVFQFAISIALIVSTLIIGRQVEFVKSKDLGFTRENMLVLPLVGEETQKKAEPLKAALSEVSGVVAVAASSEVPYEGFTNNGYFPEGSSTLMIIHVVDVDDAFLSTYGIPVIKGRGFTGASQAETDAYLINEAAAKALSWSNPIGKKIRRNGEHEVIGVVKDFHFANLREQIEPLIITRRPWLDRFSMLSVKLRSSDVRKTLASIKDVWEKVAPSSPFNFFFLDDALNRAYEAETNFQLMLGWSSLLAIVIASMGLLGLVALSVRQRTKEIGIRKVLGSSASGIVHLISREYVKLVLIANLIAWPVAGYLMNSWLQDFAYRIGLPWWAFVLAGSATLVSALAAVGIQSLRAATANPVEALRYE